MIKSVLFVCLGNICRSPTAEAVFQSQTRDLDFRHDSAGTSGWHIGDPPYGPMIAAAGVRGVRMDHLRAREFTPEDFGRFGLILGMDDKNLTAIEALRPDNSTAQTGLLLDYAPQTGVRAVPDPYYTRDFEGALDLVEAGVAGLIDHLKAQAS